MVGRIIVHFLSVMNKMGTRTTRIRRMNADFNFLIVLRSLSLKGFHLIARATPWE